MGNDTKLTSILCADVCGFSKLVADNESAALTALDECREIMTNLFALHGGRIFNTAGDAVLAEFSSPVSAVSFAIDCQSAFYKRNSTPGHLTMRWRMGLNLGEVSVQMNGDLLGDGVNIAARLESVADHGGIALGPEIHGLVNRKLTSAEFENLGMLDLKNIPEPVEVWAVKTPGAIRQQRAKRGTSLEDLKKIADSLEERARQLQGDSAFALGKMLSEKDCPIRDLERAFKWLWVARSLRVAPATDLLNLIIPQFTKLEFQRLKLEAMDFYDDIAWKSRDR